MPEQLRGNENYSIWKPVSGHVVDATTALERINEGRADQDRVIVNDTQGIYVLCDGVGGQDGGDKAATLVSKTAADSLARAIEQPNMPVTETWKKFGLALQAARQALRGRGDLPDTADSTIVMAKVERGAKGTRILECISIGDSRAYVWEGSKDVKNGKRLQMITHDNSILYDYCVKTGRTHDYLTLQKEVDNGKDPLILPGFMEFIARYHPGTKPGEIPSRILASTREYTPDQVSHFKQTIDEHDRVLICSDGLYEVLTFDEINDIFIKHRHLNAQHLANKFKEAARKKIEKIKKQDPTKFIKNDDISVIIIDSNDRPKPKFTPLQKRIALGVAAAGVIATALSIGHIGSDDSPQVITPTPTPLDTRTPTPTPYRPTVTRAPGSGLQIGSPPTGTPEPPPPQPPQKPTSTLYAPSSKP